MDEIKLKLDWENSINFSIALLLLLWVVSKMTWLHFSKKERSMLTFVPLKLISVYLFIVLIQVIYEYYDLLLPYCVGDLFYRMIQACKNIVGLGIVTVHTFEWVLMLRMVRFQYFCPLDRLEIRRSEYQDDERKMRKWTAVTFILIAVNTLVSLPITFWVADAN